MLTLHALGSIRQRMMVRISRLTTFAAVALPDLQQSQETVLNAGRDARAVRTVRAVRAPPQSLAAVWRAARQPATSLSHCSSKLWWQRSWW